MRITAGAEHDEHVERGEVHRRSERLGIVRHDGFGRSCPASSRPGSTNMRADGVGPVSAASTAAFPPLARRTRTVYGPYWYGAPSWNMQDLGHVGGVTTEPRPFVRHRRVVFGLVGVRKASDVLVFDPRRVTFDQGFERAVVAVV